MEEDFAEKKRRKKNEESEEERLESQVYQSTKSNLPGDSQWWTEGRRRSLVDPLPGRGSSLIFEGKLLWISNYVQKYLKASKDLSSSSSSSLDLEKQ